MDPESKASHESKLLYHAQQFQSCSGAKRAIVLRRYSQKCETMRKAVLVQHACHVAAWITCSLSLDEAASAGEDGSLSPVRLLHKMFMLRGKGPITERARAAVEAVRSCCHLVLNGAKVKLREDWAGLLQSLPKQLKRGVALSADANALSSREPEVGDILMFKRVRRFYQEHVKWTHRDLVESERVIADAERRLFEITGKADNMADSDAIALRKIIFATIGALAKPRHKSVQHRSTESMSVADVERLQTAADLQKRVRKILIQGLTLWRERLQLEDVQILPILNHLRLILQSFEKKHAEEVLQSARAGKQWHVLKLVLNEQALSGHENMRDTPISNKRERDSHRSTDGDIYTPNKRLQALPHVRQTGKAVVLQCSTCSKTITSDWCFTAGGSQHNQEAVMVPQNGHSKCGGKYRRTDGGLMVIDIYYNLDVCPHGKIRKYCFDCGGKQSSAKGARRGANRQKLQDV